MSSTTEMAPLLLTVEQSAQLLAIGRTRMFQLISSGAVDSVLIGASRRVPAAALQRYVDSLAGNKIVEGI